MQASMVLFWSALAGYFLDLGLFSYRVGFSRTFLRWPRWVLYAAFALHTLWLIAAALQTQACPLFTVQGSLSFLAWLTILACLVLGMRYRLKALEGLAPVLVILLMSASALTVNRGLIPLGLSSKAWVSVHALLYFLGYAAFAVMFLASGLYLLLEYQLKRRHLTVFTGDLGNLALMDKIPYVSLRVGVLCLTAGLAIGIGIVKEVRGTWFSSVWADPKTVLALFTWGLAMALLFARSTNRLRGRRAAYLFMVVFVLIFATFLGVRHMDTGF